MSDLITRSGNVNSACPHEVCDNCKGGCPDKDHPALHHLCEECHQENVKAFNRIDAELHRLHSLATRWYLADGTYVTLTEEEVIEKRKAAAKKLATLDRLRAIAARVEDVEGLARVIHETEFSTDYDSISEQGKEECNRIARALRDYAVEEG